ncbi:MAG TPA: aminotransferase [Myxococcales bacterium]|nr:aminotransferase [Myxococcales bacterium]
MVDLDTEWVRARFPGLDDELAFFENAGGSLPVDGVVRRTHEYLSHDMVQLDASYRRSVRATERVEAGKLAAARLMNADVADVVLGDSTSMNMYVLSHAFAAQVGPGDEIVVTDVDHEANRGAWVRMAKARGATLREWAMSRDTHALTLEGLDAVLSDKTKLVAFSHCSNVVGTLHDARAFVERIHAAGARAVIDGVAFAPHRRVDVRALGADAYALSLYKVYGPHLGALYVSADLRASLENQNHDFLDGSGAYELMPGNVSHELAAGLPGIVEYLEALDRHHGGGGRLDGAFALIAAHESQIADRMLTFLRAHPRVRLLGHPDADPARRVPTVTFRVEGLRSADVPRAIEARGVAIRHGHFYAARAMEGLGVRDREDGVIRASAVHYNTLDEVDRLTTALDAALAATG